MAGRSLNVDNDPFCPCEEDEDVLGQEVPYLSAIGALMYLDIKTGAIIGRGTERQGLYYVDEVTRSGTVMLVSWNNGTRSLAMA
ncbi:hypothetical protein Tco_1202602 [Tanacetum coccineum]